MFELFYFVGVKINFIFVQKISTVLLVTVKILFSLMVILLDSYPKVKLASLMISYLYHS